MNLAINYSHPAAELLKAHRIQIDFFKCPDWPDLIAEARLLRPVAVHFTLSAGNGRLHLTDWALVERLAAETGTPYINLHLDPIPKDYPGIPEDTPEPAQEKLVIENLLNDVWSAVKRFGAQRVIAENVTYYGAGGGNMRPAVEPTVIRRILEETGCGLLLDIAHARIAAHHLGLDERTYMESLPVERIRELHFAGIHMLKGRMQDHLSVLDQDWPVLEWVLGRIKSGDWAQPWLLSFEYGGVGKKFAWRCDPEVIAAQVPRLYEMVKRSE
jgi:uncharacterized protein (UPF0276 family)